MSYSFPAPGPRFQGASRRLTMVLAAAALALAGLAAGSRPARADTEDLLRFLAGAVIIGAIVHAIDDNHTPHYAGRWTLPDSCLETIRVDWRTIDVYNARCLNRAGYSGLPSRCRRDFRIGYGTRTGFIAECLWDAGYRREAYGDMPPIQIQPPIVDHHRTRLPGHCQMTYRQNGHRVQGYWGRCLREAGLHDLPRACRLTTRDGDTLYDAQCLYDAGYRRPR